MVADIGAECLNRRRIFIVCGGSAPSLGESRALAGGWFGDISVDIRSVARHCGHIECRMVAHDSKVNTYHDSMGRVRYG